MKKTEKKSLRLTVETVQQAGELARLFGGPVRPLTETDVVRECVRRVHELETHKKEKRR